MIQRTFNIIANICYGFYIFKSELTKTIYEGCMLLGDNCLSCGLLQYLKENDLSICILDNGYLKPEAYAILTINPEKIVRNIFIKQIEIKIDPTKNINFPFVEISNDELSEIYHEVKQKNINNLIPLNEQEIEILNNCLNFLGIHKKIEIIIELIGKEPEYKCLKCCEKIYIVRWNCINNNNQDLCNKCYQKEKIKNLYIQKEPSLQLIHSDYLEYINKIENNN